MKRSKDRTFEMGINVKAYLSKRGITQVYLSKKIKMPPNILSDRLNGKSEFRASEYIAICDALGVPLETFRDCDAGKIA